MMIEREYPEVYLYKIILNTYTQELKAQGYSTIGIRYSKDGDIETYDTRTGKTTGHISTMGNMIEETQEDRERYEKEWEEAMKKHGYVYHRRRTK